MPWMNSSLRSENLYAHPFLKGHTLESREYRGSFFVRIQVARLDSGCQNHNNQIIV